MSGGMNGGMNVGHWIGLVALCLALYILWQIRQILLLVFAAVVISTVLNAFARRLQRFGMRRSYAVLLALLMLATAGFIAFLLIVPPFADQLQQLTELLPRVFSRLESWIEEGREMVPERLEQYVPDLNRLIDQLPSLINELWVRGFGFLSGTFGAMLQALLVFILTIMFLIDPDPYRRAFIRLFPNFYRRRVHDILNDCERSLTGWSIGIIFNMAVIAVFSWLGLSFLKVKLALAHGVFAGLLTFIPNIGPSLSVIPPMAIALLDNPWKPLAVLALYILIQQFEGNLLTPMVMAQQVSLLPAVTLLAQLFFATFFGFLGLLLALPLTVIVQVWIRETLIRDILDCWTQEDTRHQLPALPPGSPEEPQDAPPADRAGSGNDKRDREGDTQAETNRETGKHSERSPLSSDSE